MKVFTQIDELLGKKSFLDPRLKRLEERFISVKTTFYSLDFVNDRRDSCDCIVCVPEGTLDLVVEDMEKMETLGQKIQDKALLEKVSSALNQEKLLRDVLSESEINSLKEYAFVTARPVVGYKGQDLLTLGSEIFDKSGVMFFFTAGKKESRAWLVNKNSDIVTASGKIHTDLARGFIRAEVFNIKDLDGFKNMEDAKQRGFLKIVERDYIVQDGDVITVKFSV